MSKKNKEDISEIAKGLSKIVANETVDTDKGGRPSHIAKGKRKRLNVTISEGTVNEIDTFLASDNARFARNRSHLIEIAALEYIEKYSNKE